MEKFSNVNELVNTLKPVNPIYCIRPDTIKNSIKIFKDKFPGKILYAVKTNPNVCVLKHIIKNGVDRFDVASINEVKLIRKLALNQNYTLCIQLKVEKILHQHILIIM